MRKKKNIVIEKVLIQDYAAEGKSLTKQDGKVIFVEGVVPGDVVDVRLAKSKKDWGEGFPIRFHAYSKDRVEPFCQHFGVCGGCQWQMLPYQKQLHYKQKQVGDNLSRIGKVTLPQMLPIVGASEDKFYRNKLEYTFSTKEFTPSPPTPRRGNLASAQDQLIQAGNSSLENRLGADENNKSENVFISGPGADANLPPLGGQRGAFGFHAKGFFDKVVQIEKCWLQPEPTNEIRNWIRLFAYANDLSFYDIRHHTGLLRTMQVRICTTGEVMINIVFGENREEAINRLLHAVQQQFPQITTLLYTINLKWNDSLQDQEPIIYTGKGYVIEKLEEYQFKIGPKSFFQTNTRQGERLYQIIREFAGLDGTQILYDLYCGTGSIGIFCSKGAGKIIGVEMSPAAIEDANENAILNNISHAHFVSGDVLKICNDLFFEQHGKPDVIITDPPRAGMHQTLVEKLLQLEAPLVVYVSCNPATQARDLALLAPKYAVTKVQPVDMFPHTHHIENVVQLKLKN